MNPSLGSLSGPMQIDLTGPFRLDDRVQGRTPRHFAIDPTGRYMVVANQDSDNLVVFEISPNSGIPQPTGERTVCATPVYNLFVESRSPTTPESDA